MAQIHALTPEGRLPSQAVAHVGELISDIADAYQVAVADGFTGTKEEWLASLVGPQGVEGPYGGTEVTDPQVASYVTSGTETRTALDATYARTDHRPVNLLDLGADNTGSTDLASLLTSVMGREVRIPRGVYRIDQPLVLTARTQLIGDAGATLVAGPTFPTLGTMLTATADSGVAGLSLDANDRALHTLKVTGADQTIRNLFVTNSLHAGVFVDRAVQPTLVEVTATHCGRPAHPTAAGFYVSSSPGVKLVSCVSEMSQEHGFYILGGGEDGCQVISPTARGNGGYGISLRQNGSSIVGGVTSGNARGGLMLQAHIQTPQEIRTTGISVSNLVSSGNGSDNADIAVVNCIGVTLSGMAVESASTHALRVQQSSGVTVAGGSFSVSAPNAVAAIRFNDSEIIAVSGVVARGIGPALGAGSGFYISNVDGLTVVANQIENATNGVTLLNAVSNSVIGVNGYVGVTNRVVDVATSGSNRVPGAAPPAATGSDAAVVNALRTSLINAGLLR